MICHILSALNGKISGSFMGTESSRFMGGEYARIRTAYHADAWLYGTTTTKEFTGFQRPVLDGSVTSVPEGDFVARRNAAFYYVSVDTEGEIGWESATFKRAGCPGAHIIEVVTGATSVSYLAYLREHRISYIVAGEAAQAGGSLVGLRMTMTVLPIAGLLLAVFYFHKKYILTESKMEEMNNTLRA